MKKSLISFFAVAAVLAACTKFEEDAPVQLDTTSSPKVEVTVVDDNTISVTVTGAAQTGFYSYAVVKGEAQVTADGLLKKPGSIGNLASGVVDFSKTPTTTFQIEKLTPNTLYTAYAVAASTRGVLTEVSSASATTTDGTLPALQTAKHEATDTTLKFAISFDDPVTLGDAEVKATFFAVNDADEEGKLKEYKTLVIDKKNLSASGNDLLVELPAEEAIPGAYVAITYGAGVVKNGVGQPCAAHETKTIGFNKGELSVKGIFGRYETRNWNFELPMIKNDKGQLIRMPADTVLYFADWEALAMPCVSQSKYPILLARQDGGKIISTEPSGRTVSYPAVYEETFDFSNDSTVVFMLGEQPAYGGTVAFSVAENSLEDIFGNANNEFSPKDNYLYSFGYKLDDILGTYTISCASATQAGNPPLPSYKMVIKKSDNEEEGNIMITKFLDVEGKAYLDFNIHDGSLVIPEFLVFVSNPDNSGICFYFNQTGNAHVLFEPGSIAIPGVVTLATYQGNSLTGIVEDAANHKLTTINFVATRD